MFQHSFRPFGHGFFLRPPGALFDLQGRIGRTVEGCQFVAGFAEEIVPAELGVSGAEDEDVGGFVADLPDEIFDDVRGVAPSPGEGAEKKEVKPGGVGDYPVQPADRCTSTEKPSFANRCSMISATSLVFPLKLA